VIGKNATSLLSLHIFHFFYFFFFVTREHTTDQNGLALLAQLSLGSIAPSMGKRKIVWEIFRLPASSVFSLLGSNRR
jgi:hypothetical protein